VRISILVSAISLSARFRVHLLLLRMLAHFGHHEPRFTLFGVAFH